MEDLNSFEIINNIKNKENKTEVIQYYLIFFS
jgi:hypothetical protein